MTDLLELADRVEAGEYKCCILFATICSRLNLNKQQEDQLLDALDGSLDAALTLKGVILPGWSWEVGMISAWVFEKGCAPFIGKTSNPAASLVAAMLRARYSMEEKN